MPKPDVIDRVCDELKAHGFEPIKKRFDSLAGKEGVCVRPLPSTVLVTYYDGSQIVDYVYQVIVRSRSEEKAMNDCWQIADALDGVILVSENDSFEMVSNEVYTEPQELALDEDNFYAWQVRLTAQITTS